MIRIGNAKTKKTCLTSILDSQNSSSLPQDLQLDEASQHVLHNCPFPVTNKILIVQRGEEHINSGYNIHNATCMHMQY